MDGKKRKQRVVHQIVKGEQKMELRISDKKKAIVNPGMNGLFFEDINYAADGGLYAEMIENRSF